MVAQHYRWDFIGLSTDDKPTLATSEKVVDGSTFYCSDNSKLYVFYNDTWYEKTATGGGGGSYTAGTGIDITEGTISVDTNTIQPKLTAGSNIAISEENVISASITPTELTSADYNYPVANPDKIALWLLDTGEYIIKKETSAYYADSYDINTNIEDIPVTIHKTEDKVLITFLRVGGEPATWFNVIVNPANGDLLQAGTNFSSGLYDTTYNALNAVNNLAGQCTPLSAYQGKVLNDKIKPATGASAPTTSTTGEQGKIYIDTTNGDAYICVDTTGGTYTWKKITA